MSALQYTATSSANWIVAADWTTLYLSNISCVHIKEQRAEHRSLRHTAAARGDCASAGPETNSPCPLTEVADEPAKGSVYLSLLKQTGPA